MSYLQEHVDALVVPSPALPMLAFGSAGGMVGSMSLCCSGAMISPDSPLLMAGAVVGMLLGAGLGALAGRHLNEGKVQRHQRALQYETQTNILSLQASGQPADRDWGELATFYRPKQGERVVWAAWASRAVLQEVTTGVMTSSIKATARPLSGLQIQAKQVQTDRQKAVIRQDQGVGALFITTNRVIFVPRDHQSVWEQTWGSLLSWRVQDWDLVVQPRDGRAARFLFPYAGYDPQQDPRVICAAMEAAYRSKER